MISVGVLVVLSAIVVILTWSRKAVLFIYKHVMQKKRFAFLGDQDKKGETEFKFIQTATATASSVHEFLKAW